jgi:putative MATE family efflux protein
MTLFSTDPSVRETGASYLKIVTIGFFPGFISMMLSTYLRSTGKPVYPSIASISAMILNTILNFILIFGYLGFPALGVAGAAISTTIARIIELIILIYLFVKHQKNSIFKVDWFIKAGKEFKRMALAITLPIFLSELAWSLGEAVYGMIYGHIGTDEMAAMSLIGPMVMLSIGLFAGLSQAVSILVGTELGKGQFDMGIFLSSKSIKIGIIGTIIIGIIFISFSWLYPNLYAIQESTKDTTTLLLIAFSVVLWIKVSNMILGGILKSGGKTHYIFLLDLLGTWVIGIPLGLAAAFLLNLPIHWVYLLIAFEELVRFIIGYQIFKSRKWIKTI